MIGQFGENLPFRFTLFFQWFIFQEEGATHYAICWYTYICLRFQELCYIDEWVLSTYKKCPSFINWVYFGGNVLKSTQFGQKWVLKYIGLEMVRILNSGRHIHIQCFFEDTPPLGFIFARYNLSKLSSGTIVFLLLLVTLGFGIYDKNWIFPKGNFISCGQKSIWSVETWLNTRYVCLNVGFDVKCIFGLEN